MADWRTGSTYIGCEISPFHKWPVGAMKAEGLRSDLTLSSFTSDIVKANGDLLRAIKTGCQLHFLVIYRLLM